MLDVDGLAVTIEAAVAGWLGDLEEENRTSLRIAVATRIGDGGDVFRWYAKRSSVALKRRLSLLIDSGLMSNAEALRLRVEPFDSWLDLDRETQRTLDLLSGGSGQLHDATTTGFDQPGWAVELDDGYTPLDRDELVSLRDWGVEPRLASQPVAVGNNVFVRTPYSLSAFGSHDGSRTWTRSLGFASIRALPIYEKVIARITSDILGTPSVEGNAIHVVAAVSDGDVDATSQLNLSSASDRRRLGVLRFNATTGDLEWAVGGFGVPLSAPKFYQGSAYVPARTGDALSLVRLDQSTGAVLGKYSAGALPDRDDRQIAPLYAAALMVVGDRVVAAFDEGIVACFNASTLSFEWVRPIGLPNDDARVLRLPERTDVSGGPGGMLPRLGKQRANISLVGQQGIVAECPGWSAPISLRLHDGADMAPPMVDAANDLKRNHVGLVKEQGDLATAFLVNRLWQVNSRLFGPLPFSFGVGDGVYVQTERTLRRLTNSDFETLPSDELSRSAIRLAAVARGVSSPASFVAGLFDSEYRLRFDTGQKATLLQNQRARYSRDEQLSAGLKQVEPKWGNDVTVETRELRRLRFASRYQSIPITRLSSGGPMAIAASVNSQNRLSIKLRVDGHELEELFLPGRTGNARHEDEITRGWLCGPVLALQLGRELFGVRLHRDDDSASAWGAEVAWPSVGGERVGPKYSGLLPASAYALVDTPVGSLLNDESGRWVGNVAATTSQIAVARDGSFLSFDLATGTELMRVNDRGVHELLVAEGERIWRVDAITGQGVNLLNEDTLAPAVDGESKRLLRADWSGRWIFDTQSKSVTRIAWDGTIAGPIPCARENHIAFTADAAAVWNDRDQRLLLLRRSQSDASEATLVKQINPAGTVSRLTLIDAGTTTLVGLSHSVTTPGLVAPLQSIAVSREIFQGELAAVGQRPGETELSVLWTADLPGCAIRRVQPADLPIVLADWNAQFELPSGKLSSLHVGHYRIHDRRTGDLIVEQRTNAPRTPVIQVDHEKRTIFVEWGREQSVLQFSTDANND